MSVLVTGGAGYIGSHMALALTDAERPVVVLDDLSTGFRWAVPEKAIFVEGCISDERLVREIIARHSVEAIVHFAGSIVVPDSVADPLAYYLNNTVRSRALIAAAVAGGVKRFVFSSTAAVYGEAAEPLAEDAPLAPVSPYGASKLMTERMLADTSAAHDLRYVALRYFNVAGADPAGRTGQSGARATHLIKLASQVVTGMRPGLSIFGDDYPTRDGTCVRDYIHVSDLAKAHLHALDYLAGGGGDLIANCGYGRGASVKEVVSAMKRVSGLDFPVEFAPRRPGDPAFLVAQPELVRRTLGWTPDHDDLNVIIDHALAWERKLGDPAATGRA